MTGVMLHKTRDDDFEPYNPCSANPFRAATPRTHQASNAARQTLRSATPPAASAVKSEATESSAGGSISIGTETLDPIFGGEKAATEVVVVGAGVGGLATAARLAKAGCRYVEWYG